MSCLGVAFQFRLGALTSTHPEIKSAHRQKVVAYADDLTACIKTESIPASFQLFENFAKFAGLEVNQTKTDSFSICE